MIKPSRRGEMVRFNPELWISLTEFGRARLGSPCGPVGGTAGGAASIADWSHANEPPSARTAVVAVFCSEITAKGICEILEIRGPLRLCDPDTRNSAKACHLFHLFLSGADQAQFPHTLNNIGQDPRTFMRAQ
jgi:hypothetical protein